MQTQPVCDHDQNDMQLNDLFLSECFIQFYFYCFLVLLVAMGSLF